MISKIKTTFFKVTKKRKNYFLLSKTHSIFKKLPDSFVPVFSQYFFKYGFYSTLVDVWGDSIRLGRKNYTRKVFWYVTRSYHFLGQYKKSITLMKMFLVRYPSSRSYRLGLFNLGLLYMREKNYQKAIDTFESLTNKDKNKDSLFLSSCYWHFRALEKLDRPREFVREKLITSFPLTYYGLKLRYEKSNKIEIPKGKLKKEKSFLVLDGIDVQRWKRFKTFLKVGWTEEAEKEINFLLKNPLSFKERFVFFNILSQTPFHLKTISFLSEILEEKPQLFSLNLVKKAYPLDYLSWIKKRSQKYRLEPSLILGLIRQESAFLKEAVSSSRAVGLMQLLFTTAKEMASFLKWRRFQFSDLKNPKKNISLGVYYLFRLQRAFHFVFPISLAAYNVGYGRLKKWMSFRKELSLDNLKEGKNSVEFDLWIDEMPWDETRFYVKSVWRNAIIYSLILDSSKKPLFFNNR